MDKNNVMLFTFGVIFLLIGFVSPMIREEFDMEIYNYDSDVFEQELGQQTITDTNALEFFSAVFFWVIGAPVWLNLLITMIRVIFWVIVWDKIRGIGS